MADIQLNCFKCSKMLELIKGFSRREDCPHCGADVHACKNCRFYDQKAYNECKEPTADVVQEKERANFCDFFEPSTDGCSTGPTSSDLLSEAEALFKK